jgi:hypothetical protein
VLNGLGAHEPREDQVRQSEFDKVIMLSRLSVANLQVTVTAEFRAPTAARVDVDEARGVALRDGRVLLVLGLRRARCRQARPVDAVEQLGHLLVAAGVAGAGPDPLNGHTPRRT